METISFPTCDQYEVQGDLFAQAILNGTPVPIPLEDAIAQARVIAAVLRSAASGRWEAP
jgi:predicted dehydrogenase